ncbi:hypothetical protein AJ81_03830 [Pseudothermotoga hypogea DSM 11164 = NBRC 106472]|uniref:Fibronectin type-III domain-containing protein n=1 Tax=Pseudothermotoga hypogea DSM 11164 = NBRC 106472 TaxID=1123384 RepID=A0A0X1KTN0_9THEM|nr:MULTISPECIES: fibronectin type III domain-containing protein [Pseudothermotoga]AJC74688.1 hypothetical protein AJ81_03830 [Pseudothermotoga hypogea DSM 11164 = NBRC 106472]MDI6863248.1 fibronectin type III domain-containing protein [Pseudothermotoga sp.]
MRKVFFVVLALVAFILSSCIGPTPLVPPNIPTDAPIQDGQTNVDVDGVLLQWAATGENLTYDLYLRRVTRSVGTWQLVASNLTEPRYVLTNLEPNSKYEWKVLSRDPRGRTVESPIFSFETAPHLYVVQAVEYNSGGPVEGVLVCFFDESELLVQKTTNAEGLVKFATDRESLKIVMKKYARGVSIVEGLKPTGKEAKTVPIRLATNHPDPNDPINSNLALNVEILDLSNNPIDITQPITANFKVQITFNTQHLPRLIYSKLGSIPGAGTITNPRSSASNVYLATFTMGIAGFKGEVPLYVVAYDANDNRYEKIIYLTIQQSTYALDNLYRPEKDLLMAITRRRGIEFYSLPGLENILPEVAPEGSNLLVLIRWKLWSAASGKDRPDAYNVYRSFDGENYTLIATVPYSTTYNYAYDFSSELSPGKRVWYAVSAVKGDFETELVDFGSVVPLDVFNVQLISPADKETNVSRRPIFKFKPTKQLFSPEGTVTYNFNVAIYPWVQSETYPMTAFDEEGNLVNFSTTNTNVVEVSFAEHKWYMFWVASGVVSPLFECPDMLEAGQTYDWTVGYAYAIVEDEDSVAISVACDWIYSSLRYRFDPISYMEQDAFNQFTVGSGL